MRLFAWPEMRNFVFCHQIKEQFVLWFKRIIFKDPFTVILINIDLHN